MTDPTPDEAAAPCRTETWFSGPDQWGFQCYTCPKDDGGFRSLSEAEAAADRHRVDVATAPLRAERDALRAEVERAREELAENDGVIRLLRRQRDEAEARVAAQQPVLDAAEEYVEIGGKWSHNELVRAVDAYRAASGSVEADTPAEPDGERLPPAVSPEGVAVDHDCVFRRMVRDIAGWVGVEPGENGLFDAWAIEDAVKAREVAGTPAAEPAPECEQAPHFMHTQDVIEDALVGAGYQDLPDLTDIVFVATEAARDALGICQVCGSGQPGMYPSDPFADGYAGPEECSACDGTGWALAGAGAPTEPADDTQETTP